MKIQIVVSGDGWVLDKYAKVLASNLNRGGNATAIVAGSPYEGTCDITYLMNYAQIGKLTTKGIRSGAYGKVVSMLTHHEESEPLSSLWDYACRVSDHLVPMSDTTAAQIEPQYADKATTIPLPVRDIFTNRMPRIGIAACRNPGNEWRKGWDLVDKLVADHPELEIVTTGSHLSDTELVAWYRSLDVYLCASRYEGGPMGVAEAAALGVPLVLPAGVGWCDEYDAVWRFRAGIYSAIEQAVTLAVYRHGVSTEASYAARHLELFGRCWHFNYY